jgi:hypothetical protein
LGKIVPLNSDTTGTVIMTAADAGTAEPMNEMRQSGPASSPRPNIFRAVCLQRRSEVAPGVPLRG